MCQVLDAHSFQSPRLRRQTFTYMFNKLESRGPERQSNLPKAAQLVDGSTETQAQFCPLPVPGLLSLPRRGWVWDSGLTMPRTCGEGKPGANSRHCPLPSHPVVPVTKINRNDLGPAGPGLLLSGFFKRCIDHTLQQCHTKQTELMSWLLCC